MPDIGAAAERAGIDDQRADIHRASGTADADARGSADAGSASAAVGKSAQAARADRHAIGRNAAAVKDGQAGIAALANAVHDIGIARGRHEDVGARGELSAVDGDCRCRFRTDDELTGCTDRLNRADVDRRAVVAFEQGIALDENPAKLRRRDEGSADRRNRIDGLAQKIAAGVRESAAAEQRVVDRDIGADAARRRGVDRPTGDIVARRQDDGAVGIGHRRNGVLIADLARYEHRHGVILGNGDHIDALGAAANLLFGSRRNAAVADDLTAFGAGQDIDVEQPCIDADVGLFGGDIGRRPVHADKTVLDDARGNERDIAAARRAHVGGDRGACVDADRGGAARRAAKANFAPRSEKTAGRVDIVGGEEKAADVDRAAAVHQDAAGVVEPDTAARRARRGVGAVDGAAQRDLPAQRPTRPVHEAVEHDIIAVAVEIPRAVGGQEVDCPAGRCRVGGHPVDDALILGDGDRCRLGTRIARHRRADPDIDEHRVRLHLRQRRPAIGKRSQARGDRAALQQLTLRRPCGGKAGVCCFAHGGRFRFELHDQRALTPNCVVRDSRKRGSGFFANSAGRFSGTATVMSSRPSVP